MVGDYIGFNLSSNQLLIFDYHKKIKDSYNIGQCLIDYISLDLSEYDLFYSDLYKLYWSSSKDDNVFDEFLDFKIVNDFYRKYPKLLDYLTEYAVEYYDQMLCFVEFNKLNNRGRELFPLFSNYNNFYDESETIKKIIYIYKYHREEFVIITYKYVFEFNINTYVSNIETIRNNYYVNLTIEKDNECTPHFLSYDFCNIKKRFEDLISFCLDIDFPTINSLSALERYYLYTKINPLDDISITNMSSIISIDCQPDYNSPIINDNAPIKDWVSKNIDTHLIDIIKQQNIMQSVLYEVSDVYNLLIIEFFKLIELNVKIKKCANCNRYFILKGGYNTKFCDRIPGGEKYTCQKLASLRNQKEKLDKSPILREYQKAYKRKYAQVSNKKLDRDDFILWVDEATIKRDEAASLYNADPSDQIVQEFKKYLGNK